MINNIVRLQEFLSHTTLLQSAIQRMLCWHYSSPHTYAPTHVCCAESSQKFLQHISLILCCQCGNSKSCIQRQDRPRLFLVMQISSARQQIYLALN